MRTKNKNALISLLLIYKTVGGKQLPKLRTLALMRGFINDEGLTKEGELFLEKEVFKNEQQL